MIIVESGAENVQAGRC